MTEVDVAIIGAGAAGLAAGAESQRQGLSFAVLEAKDRVGGRAYTESDSLGWPFDHGCYWLHSASVNPLREAADQLGISYRKGSLGNPLIHDGSGFLGDKEQAECWKAMDAFEARLEAVDEMDNEKSFADLLDPQNPWSKVVRQSRTLLESQNLENVSAGQFSDFVWTGEDWAVPSGYGALIARLHANLPVHLSTPVTAIDLSGPRVAISTPGGIIQARAAVVTVSTAVLAGDAIRVLPHGWPDWKQRAIESVPLGSLIKVGFSFKPQTVVDWPKNEFVMPISEGEENCDFFVRPDGRPGAIGFVAGTFAHELCMTENHTVADYVLERLATIFGEEIRGAVRAKVVVPWDRDPHVLGAYSQCKPGHNKAREELARSIDDRVYFAGEACSTEHAACAHGAHLTGIESVRRIVQTMPW